MRHRQKKSFFSPFRQNLVDRLSNGQYRFRRGLSHILIIASGLFLIYAFFGGTYGYLRIIRLQHKAGEIRQENHRLLVKLLNAKIDKYRLESDPNHMEYIARTRHFFARPGEVIYRFKE